MSVFREESGKVSMGRVFGGICTVSVIAGWWIMFLSSPEGGKDFVLPEFTDNILAIGLMPYGVGVLGSAAKAFAKNGAAK